MEPYAVRYSIYGLSKCLILLMFKAIFLYCQIKSVGCWPSSKCVILLADSALVGTYKLLLVDGTIISRTSETNVNGFDTTMYNVGVFAW